MLPSKTKGARRTPDAALFMTPLDAGGSLEPGADGHSAAAPRRRSPRRRSAHSLQPQVTASGPSRRSRPQPLQRSRARTCTRARACSSIARRIRSRSELVTRRVLQTFQEARSPGFSGEPVRHDSGSHLFLPPETDRPVGLPPAMRPLPAPIAVEPLPRHARREHDTTVGGCALPCSPHRLQLLDLGQALPLPLLAPPAHDPHRFRVRASLPPIPDETETALAVNGEPGQENSSVA